MAADNLIQIQTNLLNATRTGNTTLLNQTLAIITDAQKAQIALSVLTQSLTNLAILSNPATAATMTRAFMAELGPRIDAATLMQTAEMFAMQKNYAALDALTDNLTAGNKTYTNGNSLALGASDHVVREIAYNDNPQSTTDDAMTATAVRDFMAKLGTYVSASALIEAAEIFVMGKNYAALDALTDNLTANNKKYANGNGLELGAADHIVRELAYNDNPQSTSDDALTAATVRDFMAKLGAYVSASALIEAAEIFVMGKNYAALDALTDKLTAANKTYANGYSLALGAADHIVRELAYNDNPQSTGDDATIANTLRDFMTKLGTYVSASAFVEAAEILVMGKNYAALDALMDTVTANNKKYANGNSLALGEIDHVVRELAYNDNPQSSTDNTVITNALRGVMVKMGAYVSAAAILEAAEIFVMGKNYAALDALTDNLTAANKTYANGYSMATGSVDWIVRELVFNDDPQTTSDNNVIANALRDFMGKLGNYASSAVISEATEILALGKNVTGLDSLLGELGTAQINSLSAAAKSALSIAGVRLLTTGNDTFNGTASSEKIFGGSGNDTLNGKDGNDALYGDVGSDWLYGDNGNDILSGGAGNDVLVGGAGDDSLRGGSGTNDMTGGTGADTFVFDATTLGKSTNRIADFNRTQGDKIDISDVLETVDPTIANLSQFVKLTAGTGGVHTLSVDVNGTEGGENFVALATIVGVANGTTAEQLLTAGNLVV